MSQTKHGSGPYFKVARPIVVLPRDQAVATLDGGQSRQRLGYRHIKTILLFHILHDDLQKEIDAEFGADSDYTLSEQREVRVALQDELELYDVVLEGHKFSASPAPDSRYE
ncbi:MAG: hypothetical protein DRH70_02860 [Candidatus Coatesbacteria bacterium]|nr:MAG: hypothetical protein DRH70_02860 [Candidatus Coatesbacteria bacterium]